MKLKQEFIAHQAGDDSVLIPTGKAEFSGIVRGNRTLGGILELLSQDRTEEELVSAMKDRFDAPASQIEADVRKALSTLHEIGALDG